MSRHQSTGEQRFRQITIPPAQLRSGVFGPANTEVPWGRIALLAPRAQMLAERAGLKFADSFDGLDNLQVALIDVPSAGRVALVDHLGAPEPATEVHADVEGAEAARILKAVLAALGLTESDVLWRRPVAD
jgi:hypothetical protein